MGIFDDRDKQLVKADADYAAEGLMPAVRKEKIDWTRGLVSIEMDGIHTWDAPEFCDAFCSYAEWGDTGEPLTDYELEKLNEDSEFIYTETIKRVY